MNVQCYKISDDPRVVYKNLGAAVNNITNAYLKEDTDVINPTVIFTGDISKDFGNYCYIEPFQRYYFIRNKTALLGGKVALDLEVDVLMSYQTSILMTDAIIFNQGSDDLCNALIADGRLPMQVNTDTRTFMFTRGELNPAIGLQTDNIVFSCFTGGSKSG